MRLGVLPVKESSLLYASACSTMAQHTRGQGTSSVECRGYQSYHPAGHSLRRPFLTVGVRLLVDHVEQLYLVVVHRHCSGVVELRPVTPAVVIAG